MGAIDTAWAEAEAALPPEWRIRELYHLPGGERWLARAALERREELPAEFAEGVGGTPEEALRSLAAALSARSGRGGDGRASSEPIDQAWAEVERQLPPGWTIRELYNMRSEVWVAAATLIGSLEQPGDHAEAFGATPAGALLGLSVELGMKRS